MTTVQIDPAAVLEERPFAAMPARALTSEARELLSKATTAVRQEKLRVGDYQAASAALNLKSNVTPSDVTLVRELTWANAKHVAAMSQACVAFPDDVAVGAGLPVANVETGLARDCQLRGDADGALRHFQAALESLSQSRAYSRISTMDPAIYGISARAAAAAGEYCADRNLGVAGFLGRIDENIIMRYAPLMSTGDLSGPRAFGVVALLRRAMVHRNRIEYISTLRQDVIGMRKALEPSDPKAAKRFQIELNAIIDEMDLVLGIRKAGEWKW